MQDMLQKLSLGFEKKFCCNVNDEHSKRERALNDDTFVYNIFFKLLAICWSPTCKSKTDDFLNIFENWRFFLRIYKPICLFYVIFGLPWGNCLWEKKNNILHLCFSKLNSIIRKQHLRGFSCNFKNLQKNLVWKNPTSKCKTLINSFVSYD